MGGLFAGNMLCRAGWKVDLYERVAGPLSDRGAGIVTHDELLSALELAGARVDEHLGVRIFERATIDRHGNIVASLPYDQILTAWSRLLHVLEEAFPSDHYHRGKVLKYVQQDNNSVTAHFDDGSRDTADILIGADGIRSTTRAQLMPDQQPEYAGYVAWRGLVNEDELSSAARDQLMDSFAFCLPPGEQMLTYPVAGKENATAKGSRRLNFVWYRPAAFDTELKRLQTDSTGHWHSDGIPPGAIREDVLDEVRSSATATLAPVFAEVVHKTPQLFFQPIFDLEAKKMVCGRVALLGDAAFVARPHSGMGVTKAACDAIELVRALDACPQLDEALNAYQTSRIKFGRAIVRQARNMGACIHIGSGSEHQRQMELRYRDPETLMRETAVSLQYLNLDSTA